MTVPLQSATDRLHSLSAVWASRRLLYQLAVRNLKSKYQRSALGFVWTLLNPLLMIVVLIMVFSCVLRIKIPNYWAFLISGYFAWNFIAQMLTTGTYILAEHGELSRAACFPAEVPVLAAMASRLVEFGLEMIVTLTLLIILRHDHVPASFAFLPLLVVIQVLMALGVTLPLAVGSVFYRDIEHALPVIITLLFYVCPVFYGLSLVPARFQWLYLLNPFAGLLTLYHTTLYKGQMPSMGLLFTTAMAALIMASLGYAIFNRYKADCAEIV